jgi:Tol biopolymer transport system component
MASRLTTALVLAALVGLPASAAHAAELPGRILITGGGKVELFNPRSGERRVVAEHASEPTFLPSGKGFAYIREGGCFPSGNGCFTEYSVFEKSLAKRAPRAPGRRMFSWTRFFVRSLDAAPSGRLVFAAEPGPGPGNHGRGLEIYSSAANGSDVRRLTQNRVFDNDARVSADGHFIAFARKVHGRGQIFRMRIGGSHEQRVTVDGRRDRLPAWSPSGRRIAFISQPAGYEGSRNRHIYSIGAAGGPEHQLTNERESENHPIYAPDGRTIAFIRLSSLWIMRADGSEPHQLLAPLRPPGFELGLDWAR